MRIVLPVCLFVMMASVGFSQGFSSMVTNDFEGHLKGATALQKERGGLVVVGQLGGRIKKEDFVSPFFVDEQGRFVGLLNEQDGELSMSLHGGYHPLKIDTSGKWGNPFLNVGRVSFKKGRSSTLRGRVVFPESVDLADLELSFKIVNKPNYGKYNNLLSVSVERPATKVKVKKDGTFVIPGVSPETLYFIRGCAKGCQPVGLFLDSGKVDLSVEHEIVLQEQEFFTNSFGMKFVKIPAGTFIMGNPAKTPGGNLEHFMQIRKPFFLSVTEVTCEQFSLVNERSYPGGKLPLHLKLNPQEVYEFLVKLNASTAEKTRYRLPTEAEWEYAARGATVDAYYMPIKEITDYEYLTRVVKKGAYPYPPQEVGLLKANPYGLYDMIGNVAELTATRMSDETVGDKDRVDTFYPHTDSCVVVKGGSAAQLTFPFNKSGNCGDRPIRTVSHASEPGHAIGFRVLLEVE